MVLKTTVKVYFDNAATSPLLPEVKEKMIDIINHQYGNPSSIHFYGRQTKIIVEEARKQIAAILGASTGEIYFTSGATESINMALIGSVRDLGVKRIISSTIEHHVILHTLDYLKEIYNIEVELLQVNSSGEIDLTELEAKLSSKKEKTLVSLIHANNELGTLTDIETVSQLCSDNGAMFLADTCQSMGKLPLSVIDTSFSFLCGSAHKFHGPKGVGFVYINSENMVKPLMYGGDQERGIRSGTENIYGIAGMALALQLATDNIEERKNHITQLKSHLNKSLTTEFEDIKINTGDAPTIHHILSASFPYTDKIEMMMMNLDIMGISASGGSACSSGVENESHVLNEINHDPKRKTVRFSFSHMNTIEEVDFLIEKLKTITPVAVS